MTKIDIERTELRAFCVDVQAEAARSLELLRDIESTLAWLERLTGKLQADAAFAEKAIAEIGHFDSPIDPDDSISATLMTAQITVEDLHTLLVEKRQHGRNDHRLTDEDGVEMAYTEAIAQAADLHNALNTLRWNIGEHDIDATPHQVLPENLISDPAALRASLLSLRK